MLLPADVDIVRRDPALPGLALLLDPAALAARVRAESPYAPITSASPTYLRYKPGTSCIAGYRLDVGGTPVDVYARAHRRDDVGKLLKLVTAARVDAGAHRTPHSLPAPPALYFDDVAVVVCFFPHDDAIPSLRLLDDAPAFDRLLRKVAPGPAGALEVVPLAYKPERRFVGLLRRDGAPAAVVRFYPPGAFAAAARNAKLVGSTGALRVPKRLGRHVEHNAFALEWLPGVPLRDKLPQGGGDNAGPAALEPTRRAGAALAALSGEPFGRKLRRRTAAEDAAALRAMAAAVAEVHPAAGALAAELAARLVSRVQAHALAIADLRPVHGDFHAGQVLLDPSSGDVSMIDFDELALGDPAADLGGFVADLERRSMCGGATPEWVAQANDAVREGFLRGDARRADRRVDLEARVRAYTAAGLFRLAMDSFRSRDPDWPARTEGLLGRVAAILDAEVRTPTASPAARARAADAPPNPDSSDPSGGAAAADPAMPAVRAALDLPFVREHLAPLLPAAGFGGHSVELTAARVVRHKPGRRCLIEYDVRLAHPGRPPAELTLVAKVRAKGADERSDRLLGALWTSGFAADSIDKISVPRPVGVVRELGMTLQLKVPGIPASRFLPGPNGLALAARLADAAHKLHEAAIPARRRHTLDDEREILRSRLRLAAESVPELSARISDLADACDRLVEDMREAVEDSRTCGIHRDYYPDQVIVDPADGRLYLLDLDLYANGDPALDIGNCAAHLAEQALRETGDPDGFAEHERVLLHRYAELAGENAAVRAAGYAALTLARHVQISTLFDQRRAFTARLLEISLGRVRNASYERELRSL